MRYPRELHSLTKKPQNLYIRGNSLQQLLKKPCVAVVGSRKPTSYGTQITEQIVKQLARQGIVIISGLAFGIDSIAHQAALAANGLTIAVLPGGLDKVYPSSHYLLAEEILANNGVLLSEYPPHTKSYPYNFIARNRIIAALSNCVLIPEAAEDSGSLHTATFAKSLEKPVFAVPGPITSELSKGTNDLLKNGAKVLTAAGDIFNFFGIVPKDLKTRIILPAEETQAALITLMQQGISSTDELFEKSGLDIARFNQTLTLLEIGNYIRSTGAGRWLLK